MVCFSSLAVGLFAITFATTRERVQSPASGGGTMTADLRFLLTSNRLHQFLLLAAIILVGLANRFRPAVVAWLLTAYVLMTGVSLVMSQVGRRWMNRDGSPPSSTFEVDFYHLVRNRPWMALSFFGMLQLTGLFLRGGAVLYYFKYYCGDADLAATYWVVGSFAAIAGMLPTRWLSSRFSKRTLMIVCNFAVAASLAMFYFLGPEQTTAMLMLQAVTAFVGGPIPVLVWAMYADIADHSEFQTGRRATGLIFAAATLSQKIGCAIGGAMTGFALDAFDYAPPTDGFEHPQSEITIDGLRVMMSVLPAGCLLAGVGCLYFYNIHLDVEQTVAETLRRRRTPSSAVDGSPPHP